MGKAGSIAIFIVLAAQIVMGQPADKSLTFDVASIKPAELPKPDGRGMIRLIGPTGGPGSKDPGRIHYPYMSLKNLLTTAFDVKDFQISGPAWLDSERFEINATMPPETTKEQLRIMLQNLLAERFKMTTHRETKELPMYLLVVAKGGPKMKESAETPPPEGGADAPPPPLPGRPQIGPDGFPVLPQLAGRAGLFNIMMNGRARYIAQQQTMKDLADRLTGQLSKPVTDGTGLKGKYDFTLTFAPEFINGPLGPIAPPAAPPPPPPNGNVTAGVIPGDGDAPPDLFAAVQSQLGLKLEPKKGQVEIVVIDHMEKTPTEN